MKIKNFKIYLVLAILVNIFLGTVLVADADSISGNPATNTLSSQGNNSLASNNITLGTPKITPTGNPHQCLREVSGEIDIKYAPRRRPLDLVVIQDTSGSFGDKMKVVQTKLKEIVKNMNPEDRMMIVGYSAPAYKNPHRVTSEEEAEKKAEEIYKERDNYLKDVVKKPNPDANTKVERSKIWTYLSLTDNKSDYESKIDSFVQGDMTSTASGMYYALKEYKKAVANEAVDKDRETVFLVITDGIANIRLDGAACIKAEASDYSKFRFYDRKSFYKQILKEVGRIAKEITDSKSTKDGIQGNPYKFAVAFWENDQTAGFTGETDAYPEQKGLNGKAAYNLAKDYSNGEFKKMVSPTFSDPSKKLHFNDSDVSKLVDDVYNAISEIQKPRTDIISMTFNKGFDLQSLDDCKLESKEALSKNDLKKVNAL